MNLLLALTTIFIASSANAQDKKIPPYVKQCKGTDPNLIQCITDGMHLLRPYLAKGIPEIDMPPIEPFRIDELSLSLTTGPNGYKITLKDLDIMGASDFTIQKIKLGSPFEAMVKIPKLNIESKYTSSGVLLIVPASGNGTFTAKLDDVTASAKGKVSDVKKNGKMHWKLDSLDLDLKIKEVRMAVKKVFKNNRVLVEATNLFLRENGQEILKAMMPQLKVKLSDVFSKVVNQLLNNVPTETFYVEN